MLRKLARVTLNVLTALSLALCVASVATWARSRFADDWLWWTDGRRVVVGGATARGQARCYLVTTGGDPSLFGNVPGGLQHLGHLTERPSFDKVDDQYFAPEAELSLAGFGVTRGRWSSRARHTDVSVPLAAVALLSSALPVRHWWRRRAPRLRRASGLCPACGYDLTGNASGTCPECGTPAATGVNP